MTYQGQLIHEFQLDLDFGSFQNYQQQISNFARFLQIIFAALAIFVSLRGISSFTVTDFLIWLIFSFFVLLALQRVINGIQNAEIHTEILSPLQIYEHGIQLPGVLSEDDPDEDVDEYP